MSRPATKREFVSRPVNGPGKNSPISNNLPRRGLRREEAALYLGVSPSLFDLMVIEKKMPPAKQVGRARIWDIWELDHAFSAIPSGEEIAERDVWAEFQ